jgi:hypothetical protein
VAGQVGVLLAQEEVRHVVQRRAERRPANLVQPVRERREPVAHRVGGGDFAAGEGPEEVAGTGAEERVQCACVVARDGLVLAGGVGVGPVARDGNEGHGTEGAGVLSWSLGLAGEGEEGRGGAGVVDDDAAALDRTQTVLLLGGVGLLFSQAAGLVVNGSHRRGRG